MPEAAMRVADVADAVVASYLYRVVVRLAPDHYPSQAWFRVTSGSSQIPLEIGETTPVVDPNFEVTVVTEKTVPGLLSVLTRASAEMEGRIRVLPKAILVDEFSSEDYRSTGWKRVPVPKLNEPELAGV